MTDNRLRQWHRLFGIALTQLFQGAPWRVELDLPDGLEALRAHNLLTYPIFNMAPLILGGFRS